MPTRHTCSRSPRPPWSPFAGQSARAIYLPSSASAPLPLPLRLASCCRCVECERELTCESGCPRPGVQSCIHSTCRPSLASLADLAHGGDKFLLERCAFRPAEAFRRPSEVACESLGVPQHSLPRPPVLGLSIVTTEVFRRDAFAVRHLLDDVKNECPPNSSNGGGTASNEVLERVLTATDSNASLNSWLSNGYRGKSSNSGAKAFVTPAGLVEDF